MQPTVASVTAVAHRHKGRNRTRKPVAGTIAVPTPDLLGRLHQSTPFGFFAADFRGRLEDAKVKVDAFDATGLRLGTSRVKPAPSRTVQRRLRALRTRIWLRVLRFNGVGANCRRPLALGWVRAVAAPVLDQVPGPPEADREEDRADYRPRQ